MRSSAPVSRGSLRLTKPLSVCASPCWVIGTSLASTPVIASAKAQATARRSGGPGRRSMVVAVHGTHGGSTRPEANPAARMHVPGIVPSLRDGPLRDRDGLLLGRVEDLLF